MSTDLFIDYGYCFELVEFANRVLSEKANISIKQMIVNEEIDIDEINIFIKKELGKDFPCPREVLEMNVKCGSNNLTEGKYYLIFDDNDLYEKTLTSAGKIFKRKFGHDPRLSAWATYA